MIRKLNEKDMYRMHEWMKNPEITKNFRTNFKDFTLEDVKVFIQESYTDRDQHFAIVNKNDEYCGTISLKNISSTDLNAEYSIVLRSEAQHTGMAQRATQEILEYAFNKLKLRKVYLNVLEDNIPAIHFYEKMGFVKEGTFIEQCYIENRYHNLCWYAQYASQFRSKKFKLPIKVLEFSEKGDERGHLVAIEQLKDVPFDIKRIFYIYGSDTDVIRGQHANRDSEFVLINICGKSKVRITDGKEEEIVELNKPYKGVYIPRMLWKEMYDFSSDSILLVLSNELYNTQEYIREFEKYLGEMEAVYV